MRPILSAVQMRAFEQGVIEAGVSGQILMENAGRGAAHIIGLKLRPRASGEAPRTGSSVVGSCVRCADERSLAFARVLVLAGSGNNGGDGFVVARHLNSRAAHVMVLLSCDPEQLKGDARLAFLAMKAVGVPHALLFESDYGAAVDAAEFIVDALLGTGAEREVAEQLKAVIERVNKCSAQVVALDIPSGLHATRGSILGVAIRAHHTVTFAHLKQGLFSSFGHEYSGNITLSHIGVPATLPVDLSPAAWLLEESDVRGLLPNRSPSSHKVQAGRIVIVAGSSGTLGAARISSRAALRGGAGMVVLCNSKEVIAQLECDVAESMTHAWGADGPAQAESNLFTSADALVIGPGLGQGKEAECAVDQALAASRPMVLDADALHLIAKNGPVHWRRLNSGQWSLLTPHPGEAADLLGVTSSEIESDRFYWVQKLVEQYECAVLLKGSRPVMCRPGRAPIVSAFGSPALATAGSGDVLCGILAAQLVGAKSAEIIFERLLVAVALQGQAAQLWSQTNGDRGLLASEVGDLVPQVMARWLSSALS